MLYEADSIAYKRVSLREFLKNMAKGYNDILDNAKVPEEIWKEGTEFSVKDNTGVLSGAVDGGAEIVKDIPALLGMGLTFISDPEQTFTNFSTFVSELDWAKAQELCKSLAKNAVRAEQFEKGGQEARYATGYIATTVATSALATVKLLVVVKDLPGKLKNKLDDLGGVQGARSLVPTSLITKITQSGATKLKAWTSGKTLNYESLTGASHTGVTAEAKIFEDLESAIGNKNVLATLEDGQGRLSVVLERPGQTHQVVTVHPTSTGELKMTTFEPAYNPNLNTNIPVPASANKLVPDYKGTKYVHPDNTSYILNNQGKGVLIEMKGTRGKDFTEAFKKLGIKASDADDFTWHHMDDFQIINGKPYCTMQLVLSEVHGGAGITGMAHSGSVAQWKAFFGLTTYP